MMESQQGDHSLLEQENHRLHAEAQRWKQSALDLTSQLTRLILASASPNRDHRSAASTSSPGGIAPLAASPDVSPATPKSQQRQLHAAADLQQLVVSPMSPASAASPSPSRPPATVVGPASSAASGSPAGTLAPSKSASNSAPAQSAGTSLSPQPSAAPRDTYGVRRLESWVAGMGRSIDAAWQRNDASGSPVLSLAGRLRYSSRRSSSAPSASRASPSQQNGTSSRSALSSHWPPELAAGGLATDAGGYLPSSHASTRAPTPLGSHDQERYHRDPHHPSPPPTRASNDLAAEEAVSAARQHAHYVEAAAAVIMQCQRARAEVDVEAGAMLTAILARSHVQVVRLAESHYRDAADWRRIAELARADVVKGEAVRAELLQQMRRERGEADATAQQLRAQLKALQLENDLLLEERVRDSNAQLVAAQQCTAALCARLEDARTADMPTQLAPPHARLQQVWQAPQEENNRGALSTALSTASDNARVGDGIVGAAAEVMRHGSSSRAPLHKRLHQGSDADSLDLEMPPRPASHQRRGARYTSPVGLAQTEPQPSRFSAPTAASRLRQAAIAADAQQRASPVALSSQRTPSPRISGGRTEPFNHARPAVHAFSNTTRAARITDPNVSAVPVCGSSADHSAIGFAAPADATASFQQYIADASSMLERFAQHDAAVANAELRRPLEQVLATASPYLHRGGTSATEEPPTSGTAKVTGRQHSGSRRSASANHRGASTSSSPPAVTPPAAGNARPTLRRASAEQRAARSNARRPATARPDAATRTVVGALPETWAPKHTIALAAVLSGGSEPLRMVTAAGPGAQRAEQAADFVVGALGGSLFPREGGMRQRMAAQAARRSESPMAAPPRQLGALNTKADVPAGAPRGRSPPQAPPPPPGYIKTPRPPAANHSVVLATANEARTDQSHPPAAAATAPDQCVVTLAELLDAQCAASPRRDWRDEVSPSALTVASSEMTDDVFSPVPEIKFTASERLAKQFGL